MIDKSTVHNTFKPKNYPNASIISNTNSQTGTTDNTLSLAKTGPNGRTADFYTGLANGQTVGARVGDLTSKTHTTSSGKGVSATVNVQDGSVAGKTLNITDENKILSVGNDGSKNLSIYNENNDARLKVSRGPDGQVTKSVNKFDEYA